uniref:Uncharacterized protein n=1 Tax=Siphoviridae sp. ctGuJ10 TaxID=2825418 RepID=A0A8S5PUI3_9CAUD|nr:MAG TPA: hypothetical protein [Siphoviridae sp. ctGuJ10]
MVINMKQTRHLIMSCFFIAVSDDLLSFIYLIYKFYNIVIVLFILDFNLSLIAIRKECLL